MTEIPVADTPETLAVVTAAIGRAELVAIDTEFVREKTYYPELCLIQVATPELIACVDCLADFDLTVFLDNLLRPECVWVLHSARQDLEVVWNLSSRLPARLIDTQIAGALLGMAPQTSLQKLLQETLNVTIEKDQTRAEWNRRPLATAAVEYALNDVRYLLDAWHVLEQRLIEAGRLDWLSEECGRLLESNPDPTPASVIERTKGVGGLDPAQQRAALALVAWREARARAHNRPRRWILTDDLILKLARAQPRRAEDLAGIAELPVKVIQRHGDELVNAIEGSGSLALPESLLDLATQQRPDKAQLRSIQEAIRLAADGLGIAAELLATRRDAAAIEAGRPPDHLRHGWRSGILSALL